MDNLGRVLLLSSLLAVFSTAVRCAIWPVPYKRYEGRPVADPFCKALYPFCPTGKSYLVRTAPEYYPIYDIT